MVKEKGTDSLNEYLERKEVMQDVIDRWLSNEEFRPALRKLISEYPSLIDYNRNLDKTRNENKN